MLFAQDASTTFSVLGLVSNYGSLVLVAYIIIWVYPTARREERAEREKRATEEREERERRDVRFAEMIAAIHTEFNERNQKIIGAIEKQTGLLTRSLGSVCRNSHMQEGN
jgi:hypothetical protein